VKKISLLLIVSLMFTVFSLTGCKDKKNKIVVAEVTHSVFYAPQYVAQALGYFQDEGIEVEIITTAGADKTMAAVLSKEAHIGLMGPEATVYVYNNNQKDYAINFAQLTQRDGSFIVGRENINNFDISMFEGKEILGGREGGMPAMVLEYALRQAGFTVGRNDSTKDVNVRTDVAFDAMAGAFTSGQGDFVSLFDPTATTVEQSGEGYIVTSLGELSGIVPYTVYSTLKSYLNKNEDKIEKFTKAIYKAQIWVHNHTASEISEVIKPYFTSIKDDDLVTVVQRYKNADVWALNPVFNKEGYQKLLDILEMAGQLENEVPFEILVNNKYAEKSIG